MRGNQVELLVVERKTGKHHSRTLRKNQQVPGVLYGNQVKNVQVAAEEKLIKKYNGSAFENTIFTLKSTIAGVDKTPVLIKAIDLDPVTRRPLHFDMFVVDMNKTVRVYVELKFEGKAAGLAEGGVLQTLMRELEVECLPMNIPPSISIDVSGLGLYQALHISEITLPAGVKAVATEDLALVTVSVIEEEAVAAPVAAAAPVAGAAPAAGAAAAGGAPAAGEPEVIKKGKKEEDKK